MRRRAVFTGLARNCAGHLPRVLGHLERLAATYDEARFLFLVSDSADESRPLLEAWLAAGRQGAVVDHGALAATLPRRTERLAWLRNDAVARIEASAQAGWEHLVVADLDDVLDAPLAAAPFAAAADWLDGDTRRAAVFASAVPCYYDVWALRHARWCPDDCWHRIWGRPASESFEAAKFHEVFARQIAIPPTQLPIAVRSAFGGLGIYRLAAARTARYSGLAPDGREVSEHVAFNEAIGAAGGTLHVFPALQVRAPAEHLYRPEDFPLRWRLRMRMLRAGARLRPPWRALLAEPCMP